MLLFPAKNTRCLTIVPCLSQYGLPPFPLCLDVAKMCLHERWGKGGGEGRQWREDEIDNKLKFPNSLEISLLIMCCNMTKLWCAPIRCWGTRSRMRHGSRNSNIRERTLTSPLRAASKRLAWPRLSYLTHALEFYRSSVDRVQYYFCQHNWRPNRLLNYIELSFGFPAIVLTSCIIFH